MNMLYKEITAIFKTSINNPMYGVEYKLSALSNEEQNSDILQDGEAVEDSKGEITNALAAYLAEGGNKTDRPVYCPELGLSVEHIKTGFSIQKLWEVIPSTVA